METDALVPLNLAKKNDEDNPAVELVRSSSGIALGRVMSSHDLPVSRLEYY